MEDRKEKIGNLLSRNIEEVYVKKELEKVLLSDKKVRIYIGVDPSSPVIHIGHAVGLRKLREFQDLGHKVIFLIGDFTGRIGDPTDRGAQRVQLTAEEVRKNAETYVEQAGKILDIKNKQNPIEIRYNGEWHDKMTFKDLIMISANFTVQQMIERDMYQKRMADKKPIGLHEFLYPVMQGYDSVALDVDIELGGTDQTFNMLAGRTLMKAMKNKDKAVITVPLLLGTDGRKMSKSFGNVIGITDPPKDMFGKVMSIKDDLIVQYFELATRRNPEEISALHDRLQKGENPRNVKFQLATDIVTLYHGDKEAADAASEFERVFKNKENPAEMPELKYVPNQKIIDVAVASGLVSSKSEARRLIEQGGMKMNEETINDLDSEIKPGVLKVGKRKYIRIISGK